MRGYKLTGLGVALALAAPVRPAPADGAAPVDPARFIAEQLDLELAHDWTGARKHAERARRLFAQAGDALGEAACYTQMGAFDLILGEREAARTALGRALELLDPRDPLAFAAVARFLARYESSGGLHDLAEGLLRRALAALENLPATQRAVNSDWFSIYHAYLELPAEWLVTGEARRERTLQVAEAAVQESLGEILLWQGRLGESEAALLRALELSRAAGGLLDAQIEMLLGLLRQRQNRLEEATARFAQAFAGLGGHECERPRGQEERQQCFFVLERLGDLAVTAGRGEEALEWNDRGLVIFRRLRDPTYETRLLLERGWILRSTGQPELGREALEEALRKATGVGDPDLRDQVIKALARQSLAQGHGEEAAHLQILRDLVRTGTRSDVCAEGMDSLFLAMTYVRFEAAEPARKAVDKALARVGAGGCPAEEAFIQILARTLREPAPGPMLLEVLLRWAEASRKPDLTGWIPPLHLELFDALRLFLQGHDLRSVRHRAQAAVRSALARRDVTDEGAARHFLAFINDREGRAAAARRQWTAALAIFRRLGLRQQESQALGKLSELAWKAGDLANAVRLAKKAVDAFEASLAAVQVDDLLTGYLGSATWIYENLVEMLARTGQPEEALASSERARAQALLRLLGAGRAVPAAAAEPNLLAEAEALQGRLLELERQTRAATHEAEAAPLRRAADEARQEHEDLLLRLKLVRRAAPVPEEPFRLGELQSLLPHETTLVSFFVTRSRTLAWVVARDRLDMVAIDFDREALAQQIGRFREEIAARSVPRPGRRDRGVRLLDPDPGALEESAGDDLFRRLVVPLAPHLRSGRLLLVPHDSLHLLPFAALRDPDTGRYLVEDYELSYTPSASALRYLVRRSGVPEGGALVLGDPAVPRVEELPDLGGARREAEIVAQLLGTVSHSGAEATETLLRGQARGVDVLHVAAHNVPSPGTPRFAYLALAPDDRHDGKLEMREIFEELDLSGVDLVTLSACETALGKHTGGDEVVGLTRALLYAGAGSVLATLWSVDDDSSASLMTGFYQRLQAGEPAARALAKAQRELLASEGTTAPFYWAAYTLVGEPWQPQRGSAP